MSRFACLLRIIQDAGSTIWFNPIMRACRRIAIFLPRPRAGAGSRADTTMAAPRIAEGKGSAPTCTAVQEFSLSYM